MFDANLRAVKESRAMATISLLNKDSALYKAGLRQGDCVLVNMLSQTVVAPTENVTLAEESEEELLVYAGELDGTGFIDHDEQEFTKLFSVILDYALMAREVKQGGSVLDKTLGNAYEAYREYTA